MEEAAQKVKEKLHLEENKPLAVCATTVVVIIATLLFCKILCGGRKSAKKVIKKKADGKGPTGKGKAKIYHSKRLRSSRVTWLIEELGIQNDFKIIEFNTYTASDDELDWYRSEVNPNGLVPAMVFPDGTHMIESAAMCMYIADKYGKMLPDPEKEPVYYSWMVHGVGAIGTHLNNVYLPVVKNIPEYRRDRAVIARAKDEIRQWLHVFEKHLDDGRIFICGETMTAVDCVVGYTTMYASVVDNGSLLTADDFPNVMSYLTRLKKRPAFLSNVGSVDDWP